MKAIKIIAGNADALAAVLKAANGRSTGHTLTSGAFVLSIASTFEEKLNTLTGNKKLAGGAKAVWVSGVQLPNAYKYKRIVTRLSLERRSADWWLVDIQALEAYKDAGPEYLILSVDQDAAAVAKFRRQYSRATPVSEPVAAATLESDPAFGAN